MVYQSYTAAQPFFLPSVFSLAHGSMSYFRCGLRRKHTDACFLYGLLECTQLLFGMQYRRMIFRLGLGLSFRFLSECSFLLILEWRCTSYFHT
ncbi:hypothetical protein CPC08DRAFT_223512 [Agrocybe pediades]|nr:hypothetical protein CPC08DRAFT_223512 [Agrocybe pediades]